MGIMDWFMAALLVIGLVTIILLYEPIVENIHCQCECIKESLGLKT